jgi:hypothetical protein
VTEPVDTVKGIGTGIGRWVSDVGRSVVSDDPHQANVFSTAIGYAAAKRAFAYEYGVDPYTTYQPVQKRLGEIARAAVAGGLTPKVAFGLIKQPVGLVLRVSGTADSMKRLVRDKSPAELEDINEDKLKAMGVSDQVIRAFLKNPHLNPQETTLLVGELEAMKGVEGRDVFVAAASYADEDDVARFVRLKAQMMGQYHASVSPAERIIAVNGTPFLQRQDGVVIGLFPVDHMAWTARLYQKEAALAEAMKKIPGVTGRELWLTGTVEPSARKALESRGWAVKERVGEKLFSDQG